MKRRLLLSLLFVIPLACGIVVVAFKALAAPAGNILIKVAGSTGTPVQLTTTDIRARTFLFIGNKTNRVENTGVVWLQFGSDNDDAGIPLQPGAVIGLTFGPNGLPASSFWLDVETANDGVVAILLQ